MSVSQSDDYSFPRPPSRLFINKPLLGALRLSTHHPVVLQQFRPSSISTNAIPAIRDSFTEKWGNDVTEIRDLLHKYNHCKWGFVIYRCTYDDDAAWALGSFLTNRYPAHT